MSSDSPVPFWVAYHMQWELLVKWEYNESLHWRDPSSLYLWKIFTVEEWDKLAITSRVALSRVLYTESHTFVGRTPNCWCNDPMITTAMNELKLILLRVVGLRFVLVESRLQAIHSWNLLSSIVSVQSQWIDLTTSHHCWFCWIQNQASYAWASFCGSFFFHLMKKHPLAAS